MLRAQLGAEPSVRLGNHGVPDASGLLRGERPVGRTQAQRERERLPAVADLCARVDVEQPQLFQHLARRARVRTEPDRGLQVGGRDARVDDQRDVLLRDRERRDLARLERAGRRSVEEDVQVDLERDRARRQVERGDNLRVQLARVPDERTGRPRLMQAPAGRFSGFDATIGRTAPALGEHTAEVLRDLAELTDPEIQELRRRGVV